MSCTERRAILDLNAYQGDTFTIGIDFVDENGAALNLTGATWSAQVRRANSRTAVKLADFTIDSSGQATGRVVLTLANTVTIDLPRHGYWDIQRTDVAKTYVGGHFKTHREITTV